MRICALASVSAMMVLDSVALEATRPAAGLALEEARTRGGEDPCPQGTEPSTTASPLTQEPARLDTVGGALVLAVAVQCWEPIVIF